MVDIKLSFFIENVCISIQISLKFIPKPVNDNKLPLVQIMAKNRTNDYPFFEPMIIDT